VTITGSELEHKLLTVGGLVDKLKATEPLAETEFQPNGIDEVEFFWPNGWNLNLKDKPGTEKTTAKVVLQGTQYSLTKDAALQATSLIGVTRQYAMKTPGPMMAEHLNYWMTNTPTKTYKLLHSEGVGMAFTKGVVVPVSNVKLLLQTVAFLGEKYDTEDIRVDYKFHHDLRFTKYRLIVADAAKFIDKGNGEVDRWSLGLDVQNSLTAEAPLQLRGYLFSWACTNGATSTHATSGSFSRKGGPTEEGALEWAGEAFDEVLNDLDHEFESIQALTQIDVEGEINGSLREIFEKYKVPAKVRQDIINELYSSEDLTMYGVLAAITASANNPELTHQDVSRLLEIGGDLPGQATGRCKSCHRLPIG
jgi:hypothetical protein